MTNEELKAALEILAASLPRDVICRCGNDQETRQNFPRVVAHKDGVHVVFDTNATIREKQGIEWFNAFQNAFRPIVRASGSTNVFKKSKAARKGFWHMGRFETTAFVLHFYTKEAV